MKTMVDYFLYDERFYTDEDAAICFEVCETLEEARESAPDYGAAVIVKTVSKWKNGRKWEIISQKIVT